MNWVDIDVNSIILQLIWREEGIHDHGNTIAR